MDMFTHHKKFRALFYYLGTAAFVLISSGLLVLLGDRFDFSNPLITFLIVMAIVVTLLYFKKISEQVIERYIPMDIRGNELNEKEYSQIIANSKSVTDIFTAVQNIIESSIKPASILFYVLDPKREEYVLLNVINPDSSEGIRFSNQSYLVRQLQLIEFYRPKDDKTLCDSDDQARIELLGSQLIVPMKSMGRLLGWLALGDPEGGRTFSNKEQQSLIKICTQAAIAFQGILAHDALTQLERELNAFTRVAQGISFTAAFDDMLELITSQACLVVPADDFRITLYQGSSGRHYHVFVSQQNERLPELENKPLTSDAGLEIEVIRSQRPLITDDYAWECRERGVHASIAGIYAWMGVPLNAGAETIGVISIASRNAETSFNVDQEKFMHSIADLTAGAIVKSRLLEESQHRAAQLAILSEISLELTSTLELKPLYNKILKNAVQIMQCEAGYLLVVDLQTSDLIIETTHGPFLNHKIGERLAKESNFAGLRVLDGAARIFVENPGKSDLVDNELFESGFEITSILSVPMRIQDRVSGVIVLINKPDGRVFNRAEMELLTTYTNQASIAIENARLYTLTDRALAERVDELSVMQQIDRRLNATLEVESALQITLDWALKQSQADAGLIGIVHDHQFKISDHRGYPQEVSYKPDSNQDGQEMQFIELSIIESAIQSGQAQSYDYLNHWEQLKNSLLEGVKSQAVIPIRREAQVIGVLLLESMHIQTFSAETMSFLSRLSDHAAIALANARLFEEVKDANISKSRFVSFVAHELKNPMASIKGYTELIAGGMAGPVTDMQASFLATVRSNVDRMNTIVSDLNDLTKIQVGNLRLDCSRVCLSETLVEVTRSLQRQIDEKELIFTKDIPTNLPDVWADASRLSQVLTNLISNAVKYTHAGGVISVMAEEMPAIESSSSEVIHISVQDHGIGIPLTDQKMVFQQYFRTDAAKEMASGTGLGLNITRSLVELQGGNIWFESEPGAGTTFHFTLPVYDSNIHSGQSL